MLQNCSKVFVEDVRCAVEKLTQAMEEDEIDDPEPWRR